MNPKGPNNIKDKHVNDKQCDEDIKRLYQAEVVRTSRI